MLTPSQVIAQIKKLANLQIASHSQQFFKTGPGEYGEDDQFLGIRVPVIRQQVKKFRWLSLEQSLINREILFINWPIPIFYGINVLR